MDFSDTCRKKSRKKLKKGKGQRNLTDMKILLMKKKKQILCKLLKNNKILKVFFKDCNYGNH